MRTSANILFCIIVLTLSACGGGSFEKRLSALDSVLKDKPDSIYELLLGMEEEAMAQNKAGRMYYELLRADAQNKAYVDFTTDSVMKTVADYYDRHGSANEQMRAHYLLGCTYRDLKDVPMELQCFQDAVEKADTTKKDCDLYTLYIVYGQLAEIYHNQFLPDEELKALEKCAKVAMYNYSRQEKIAKEKTIESAEAKATIYVISIIAIVVLFALSIVIVVLRHRAKERERIHREQEKILLNRYNETNGIIHQLEQEKESLKADSILNEQLVQKIKEYEREKQELETKLKELGQITDDVDFKAWYGSFIDCDAANKLHAKTIISPNSVIEIEDELWDELCKQIKKHCPAFLAFIDSYSLNQTHYRILLLNTFNFTSSEISILLNKTTQQISNIHNSISKKLFPSCKETRKLKQNIQQILREKRGHL